LEETFKIKDDSIEIVKDKYVSKNLTLRAITKGYNIAYKTLYWGICSKESMVSVNDTKIDLILPKSLVIGAKHVIKAEAYE
jgi:hypothetical protein